MKKSIYHVLFWMFLFLSIISALCGVLFTPLYEAFMANKVFNSMILGVFILGIMINFRQVLALLPEATWVGAFRQAKEGSKPRRQPNLLSSMAKMLTGRSTFTLSTLAMRSLLDGIRSRLDESRDLSRYMIGLLIFLGLLGTFWGLLATLGSIGTVIDGLTVRPDADIGAIFNDLKSGLKEPLTGMGVAFSSSLFGLAGSLVLGLLDLQAGHAQNRFCNTLEEWLAELTQLSSVSVNVDGEPQWPDYLQSLMEQTAENLDKFQRQLVRSENERIDTNVNLVILAEKIEHLTQQLYDGQKIMLTLAENSLLGSEQSIPESMRTLNSDIRQMSDRLVASQNNAVDELRGEVRLLARTISKYSMESQKASQQASQNVPQNVNNEKVNNEKVNNRDTHSQLNSSTIFASQLNSDVSAKSNGSSHATDIPSRLNGGVVDKYDVANKYNGGGYLGDKRRGNGLK